VILLARKLRSTARLRRRAIEPLLWSIIALAVSYAAFSLLRAAEVTGAEVLRSVAATSALAIPALLAGQIRGRVFAATSLAKLVAREADEPVTPARVQELVRDALGDPSLVLAFWSPERSAYLGVDGSELTLPADTSKRAVTPVIRGGGRVAVLVHDPSLDEDSGIVEGLASTAMLLLEHAQLVDELKASRGRIAVAAERERLRLERDLHDGAQQRLMMLQIKLAQAQSRVGDGELAARLGEIAEDAAAAVEDLRALGQGIYPTVLRERGLADGLRSVAGTSPVSVRVVDDGVGRCPPAIEAAVYFCCLEAIQNAIKHAGMPARVTVTLGRRGHDVAFTVADDGIGFDAAESASGIGLISMRDRIGAVGGTLEIDSAPGRGTVISGTVPLAGSPT
jgi:signal transduction histidine kinase